ncbi:MATE efflux family protein [Natrialba magadii ATCC 43099]|uniref:Multidrug-efflux transporter n=1 Tax=Natrialba magadii (strain ATCC 43099 / DSM 3394 / CCM 3739 / CIP 104546 / IAM 13178 / JCM 8861 / NBRC 102185 / NCIMB 2190 / MS3) TaxID=547559 RepID=D3SUI8_NATMM|nr:MATE family efflux transporter [Natrialba magadii]ADD05246.1 MATE efflux family protein [Natrialba magadii ATCC 43099]ELY29031.1 MATE efflux family protein [Natrialba magadii ATCC 43099]
MLDLDRTEITTGPIPKILAILAAPLLVQNLVQVLQQVVDTLWLGRYSLEAVAAVGLTFPLTGLLAAVSIGASVGTQVLVSQRVGADADTKAQRGAANGIVVGFLAGGLAGLVVAYFAADIVAVFGANELVTQYAAAYLAVSAILFPAMSTSEAIESGFIGWGETRVALYINIVAVGTNIVLDPFLIFGWWLFPELGVTGAALATGIGYAAGFGFGLVVALRARDGFHLPRNALTFSRDDCREIIDIGWPTAGQYISSQSARVGMVWLVTLVGGAAGLAAYTIGARVAAIAFVPALGLQQAAQSMIGQNLGAERPGRARRTTWTGVVMASVGLTVVGVVQWLIPETLSVLFVPDATPAEVAVAADYLRILAYSYWAIGATYLLQAGFNGARRTRTSLIATLLQYWIVRIPVALAAAYLLEMGVNGVFWAVTISNIVAALGLGAYYWYETATGMNTRAVTLAQSEAAD